jgi:hypothetical protein
LMIASIFFTRRLLHLLRRSIAGRRGRASRLSLRRFRATFGNIIAGFGK